MELKQYQADTLSVLQRFFEEARVFGPKEAYECITKEPELEARLGKYGGVYTPPFEDFPGMPYVCLRLPTGGGKTILGAYAVHVARDSWIDRDYPLVLWLVPTNTIRTQTAQALKDPSHPYRQVLDEKFNGRVRVFDIADFTHITPQDLRDRCCLVIGTIQALRVKSTQGRKVYDHNEELERHFANLPTTGAGLEKSENGKVKFSFANLLYLHRPLLIVDEAHNAVTALTREVQGRLNPSAIIEFTATPKTKSNILYSVRAQELKDAEMIKLPVILSENDTWQNAVSGAVAKRFELAECSAYDGGREVIRPIVLFQAQKKNQDVTVETLRRHLIEVEHVPLDRIAVATGDQRQLDGINLFDPQCPIEYVITVEALKEGWDCSFAYVFCSVSRIQSAQNVEQLFGRVLRMPYARRRKTAELNWAYAYVSEPSFGVAASAMADKLVKMGFEEDEVRENLQSEIPGFGDLTPNDNGDQNGLFEINRPIFNYTMAASEETAWALREITHESLTVRHAGEDGVELTIVGGVGASLEKSLVDIVAESEVKDFLTAVENYRKQNQHLLSPAEQGGEFRVPRLMAEIQGRMEFADTDTFMEHCYWSLLDHPARLNEHEFSVRQTERSFEIDLDGRRVRHHFLWEQEQLALNFMVEGWTPENLAVWLDRQVHEVDIGQMELLRWLTDLIYYLTSNRGLHITALTRCKFLLARRIREKLNEFRAEERQSAYRRYLFEPEARVQVSFDTAFEFRDGMYRGQPLYKGSWKPNNHFLGPDRVPVMGGIQDGEEVQCAQALDSLPQVKYWVRNVSRHPDSFWLPTSTDKFYPDFVAQLNDGRLFVVEYKGELIADGADTTEKRTIGALWQDQSNGNSLFLIVEKQQDGLGMRGQLMKKVA